ncbi:MAG TPA: DUF1844 domain-containing protein [Myxococcota bacterium]
MSSEGEREEPKFKVVDRRRFHEDGSAREGPDVAPDAPARPVAAPVVAEAPKAEPPKAAAPAPAPAQQQPPAPVAPPKAGQPPSPEEAPNGLSFSIFLQSLAQQALMQLGLIPWPHGQRELHLEQARDTIDILQLLKVKTKGNLSAEENQLMDTVVYELKMSWVEVQQAIARSKGAGPLGGGPLGGMPLPKPPGR